VRYRNGWRAPGLGAGLLVFSALANAAAPSLMDVYRTARDADPTLRSAQATLEITRQRVPEALAALMPAIALSGDLNSISASTQFTGEPLIQRDGHSRSWTLQLTQPLFRVANVIANSQAEHIVASAQAQFALAQQDLIVRVAQAYFAVNVAQDAIGAADAQTSALREQLKQVTEGVKYGTKAITDIDDTNTRLAGALSQRVAAQNDLEVARSELQKITGVVYPTLTPLAAAAALARPSPMDAQSWIDQAASNNPAVTAQVSALRVARLEVQRAQAGHLPTVDFVVSSGHSYNSHSLTTPADYATHGIQHQIGVQISVPIFEGGAVMAKVSEARGNVDKTDADLESARRSASSDAQRAFSGVLNGLAQVDALTVAVQSGVNALKGNEAGFRAGVRTNVDVLNAEQQLYAARRDLSKARYDVLLQGIKLKAAAGALSEADLGAVNSLFDLL
jgi:outer membrane protein